jgi:hypothetical protein
MWYFYKKAEKPFSRQLGYLIEIRGFPSLSYDRFGFFLRDKTQKNLL